MVLSPIVRLIGCGPNASWLCGCVDMRIGIDVASLAFKKQVDQIVLIAGDADFVPAAKQARREGVDFILDPMWRAVPQGLQEHIDGLRSSCTRPKRDHLVPDASDLTGFQEYGEAPNVAGKTTGWASPRTRRRGYQGHSAPLKPPPTAANVQAACTKAGRPLQIKKSPGAGGHAPGIAMAGSLTLSLPVSRRPAKRRR
ncbi:NYN domain-containing protein [Cupriavidus sp. DF5525]|uniref:NYN domain-containing protein n=1 Tax=Cupriavidus sp. DF5525 TaxID=3160989 RepID=UPI00267AABD3